VSGLPWVRLDSGIGQNPKVIALAVAQRWRAVTVYMVSLGWSGQQGTNGFIPAAALPFVHATRREANQLTDVGLWHRSDIGDGWIINDWNDYQVGTAYTEQASVKGRKGNCVRWHGHACGCWKAPENVSLGDRWGNPTYVRTNELTSDGHLDNGNHLGNAREKTGRNR
jgi:hypothetical protein